MIQKPLMPALLMLDDGACFEGNATGACMEATGEVVFTTGMCGYQETLTDPSYYGQIVVFTAAHMGNYGASSQDDEGTPKSASAPSAPDTSINAPARATTPSDRSRGAAKDASAVHPHSGGQSFGASGAVFHDLFTEADNVPFQHWRASHSLNADLAARGITGICNLDTRALTLHLRRHGARNGIISALDLDRASLLRRAKELPSMQGQDLARKVTCREAYAFEPKPGESLPGGPAQPLGIIRKPLNVAVIDYGAKRSILLHLMRNNMRPTVWPATASAEDILAGKPDAVMLTNGPGDPDPCDYAIKTVRGLLGKLPLFGICLGHQLLGLAVGGKTYKLPFGHHGVNHPVKDLESGRVLITSQNHGFCVEPESLPANLKITHWNLNDNTLEGMALTDVPAFSVQFHPEAAPGTWDAYGLFEKFRSMAEEF